MILQRLKEYSKRIELPPPAYKRQSPQWLIKLRSDGSFINIENVGHKDDRGRIQAKERWVPNPGKRASGISAGLLADTGEYVLGRLSAGKEEKKGGQIEKYRQRVIEKHIAFNENIARCTEATEHEAIAAIQIFLSKGHFADDERFAEVDGDDWVTFEVNGIHPADLEEVREFWANYIEGDHVGVCMVCGRKKTLVRRHPVALKSIPGGQSSGVQLISANADPFYSYGLEESYIAPMCRSCAEKIHHVINHLVQSDKNSFRIGQQIVYIFWAKKEMRYSINNLLTEASEDDVKALLGAPYKGKGWIDMEVDGFYALALSGSGGRAVVRDWIETTLPEAQQNLKNYFDRQRIIGEQPYHPLYHLAASTVPGIDKPLKWLKPYAKELKKLATSVPVALFQHALSGKPLPVSLLSTALRRCAIGRKEQDGSKRRHVDDSQAALIKLYIISTRIKRGENLQEDWMVSLDDNCKDSAYLYGRLFYVLEWAQEEATGGEGVERTFGSAMTSPVSTLPRLIARAKQAHLPKLRRDKPVSYRWLQRLLTDILDGLSPSDVSTVRYEAEEQSLFVLGYYHQRANRFRKKEDKEKEQTEIDSQQELDNE
ncbi:MAG: type I-C CRISPR-associated protein Cas8c/Csd1 [Candidatus Hatepunaea meridiana]|nr:type I-C CRISPR-associated protein Cas8c/Csd1 [Candidatus Hatepunaea meridiana]